MTTATKNSKIKKTGSIAAKKREALADLGLVAEVNGFEKYCCKPIQRAEVDMQIFAGSDTPGLDIRDEVHGVEVNLYITLADGSVVEKGMSFDLHVTHQNKNVEMPELMFKGWI